jgi:hypothetical protein
MPGSLLDFSPKLERMPLTNFVSTVSSSSSSAARAWPIPPTVISEPSNAAAPTANSVRRMFAKRLIATGIADTPTVAISATILSSKQAVTPLQ